MKNPDKVPARRTHTLFTILLGIIAIIGGLLYPATNATAADTVSLVVKLVDGLSPTEQAAVIARNGGVETSSVPALRLHVVTIAAAVQPLVLQNYQADAQVVSIEVNKTRKAEATPTDANYGVQWALSKIGWEPLFGSVATTGTATLALLDTGIDATHPELAGKVIPGISILDGSNGLNDPSGHGTWLAGIAAATTNNGTGIAGAAFGGVQVMPVSVLNSGGTGQDSDIIAGIVWAVDHGADVILMGFSNPDFSQNLQDAIDYAWSKGAVLVAATGNDGVSTPTFPAGDRGVIGVSATDPNDLLSTTSNYGLDTFLAAPGTDIYTTDLNDGYSYISGTSASSAFVAGAAAFMKAVDPTLTNGVIVGRLARGADAIGIAGDPNNPAMFGNGLLNMAKALADTGFDPIQPVGTPGGGGPFVGPYTAAGNSSVTGTVTIAGTSTVLSGVTVACTAGCNSSFSTITDSFGVYAFSQAGGNKLTFSGNSGIITLNASKSGYADQAITFDVTNTSSYTKNFALTPTCTQPSISIQPSGVTKTAGDMATFTVMASGTAPLTYQWSKNGTDISGATSSSYAISSLVASDAGTFVVVVTNGCGSATSAPATLTVSKATQTLIVTTEPPTSAIFGTSFTVAASGGASGNPVAITTSGGCTNVDGTVTMTSGTTACTVIFNQAGNDNYSAAPELTRNITANKADAVIVVTPYDIAYDGNDHTATGTATGVNNDSLSGLDLSGTVHANAGSYSDSWTFTDVTGNYNNANGLVNDKIAKANATCTINGYTGDYDATAHGAAGSCTGIGNVTLSGLDLGATFTDVPGGTAHWTFSNANYKDQSGDVAIVINKANATCAINNYTGDYDATAHGAAGSCTGIGNVTLSGLDLGATFTDVPGGTAHWTFSNANYKDQNGDVAIVINKANATCAINGYNGVYDAAFHGAVGSCTGIGGENAGILILGATFKNVPGGTAHWTFTGNGNYKDNNSDAAIVITKANATCTISGYSGLYDGAFHGASGSCTGVGTDATLSGLGLGATFKNVPGGTAHWTFSGGTNYNDNNGDANIVINKASLTATADNKTIVFGAPLPTFTFQYSSFVNGENASVIDVAPTCNVGQITMFGNYPIVCSGGSDNNYDFKYVNGTLNVQAWTLKGFYQPVDMSGVWNTVKNGSTVPLKFEVFAGSTEIIDVARVKSVTTALVTCTNGFEDAIEEVAITTTGGTELRYDTTGGQFIDNWKTPKTPNTCYRVTMTTQDGSSLMALFKLK
jgi:subtilisin family serine protease